MKTNQVLKRPMGGLEVSQRTVDGMFNANDLLQQWNKLDGITRRRMDDFLNSSSTKRFINAIIEEESQGRNFAIPENQVVIKGRSKTLSNGKKVAADIWMHPLLFIDFAMWLNPEFKVKVLKFVYDQLVKFRNEAGDSYKELCGAIALLVPKEKLKDAITNVAKGINYCVYGRHEQNIRNKRAEVSLMKKLLEMQDKLAMLINEDFLKSYPEVMNYLRSNWKKERAKSLN